MKKPSSTTLRPADENDVVFANVEEDIRDRVVLDANGEEVGKVEDLLVDNSEKRVRFLRVESGGFLGIGNSTFIIPVDAITRIEDDTVHIDRTRSVVAESPAYVPELENQAYLDRVYEYYGYTPYWDPGYVYPRLPA